LRARVLAAARGEADPDPDLVLEASLLPDLDLALEASLALDLDLAPGLLPDLRLDRSLALDQPLDPPPSPNPSPDLGRPLDLDPARRRNKNTSIYFQSFLFFP
jgi:hypothetical protein